VRGWPDVDDEDVGRCGDSSALFVYKQAKMHYV